MIKQLVLVGVMTCVATATSIAVSSGSDSEQRFRNLDRNQDDHVSLYEARDKHRVFHYYQKADKNEDGHLDITEFSAFEIEVPDYEAQ